MTVYYIPPRIGFWGDSLALNIAPYLGQALAGQYRVENDGVGGQDSSSIRARLIADTAAYGWPTIIWCGTNNLPEGNITTTALTDVATMVAALTSDYVILTPFNKAANGVSYQKGGSIYNQMQTFIATLKSTYPGRVFDIRASFIALSDPVADATTIAQDCVPVSLTTDGLHPNTTGGLLLGHLLANCIRGIFTNVGASIDLPIYPATTQRIGIGTESPSTVFQIDANTALGGLTLSNSAQTAQFAATGISGGANGIINADALGDWSSICNGGSINFSSDNGSTLGFSLRAGGGWMAKYLGSDPAAPPAGYAIEYYRSSGGKGQKCVRFPTGAIQVVATEP